MTGTQHGGFAAFPLEQVALGLLISGPKHGYELYQDFVKAFGLIWKAGRSKFYATLAALQSDGYLQVTTEPQEDRPPRKVYRLTDSGRESFMKWLHQPVKPLRCVRVELLAKLRFFHILALPDAGRLIDDQLAFCNSELDRMALEIEERQKMADDPFDGLVYDFRQRQAHFIIDWLVGCKEFFQQGVYL